MEWGGWVELPPGFCPSLLEVKQQPWASLLAVTWHCVVSLYCLTEPEREAFTIVMAESIYPD